MFSYEVYEKLRNERGLRDKHVADATGITRSTFSDWKSGRSEPKLQKIMKISEFLKINPADIAGEPVYTIEYDNNLEKIKKIQVNAPSANTLKSQEITLDSTEISLINSYRQLNDMGKGALQAYLGFCKKQEMYVKHDTDVQESVS